MNNEFSIKCPGLFEYVFIPQRLWLLNGLRHNAYRVVYGGVHTVLLDTDTGKRICKVTREKGTKHNLYKAILYLLCKFQGIGGNEIQKYIDCGVSTKYGLMQYLLQYGDKQHYTPEEVDELFDYMNNNKMDDEEIGFMLMLLSDRFSVGEKDVDELFNAAACSETEKTKLRMLKKKQKKTRGKSKAKKDVNTREDLEQL